MIGSTAIKYAILAIDYHRIMDLSNEEDITAADSARSPIYDNLPCRIGDGGGRQARDTSRSSAHRRVDLDSGTSSPSSSSNSSSQHEHKSKSAIAGNPTATSPITTTAATNSSIPAVPIVDDRRPPTTIDGVYSRPADFSKNSQQHLPPTQSASSSTSSTSSSSSNNNNSDRRLINSGASSDQNGSSTWFVGRSPGANDLYYNREDGGIAILEGASSANSANSKRISDPTPTDTGDPGRELPLRNGIVGSYNCSSTATTATTTATTKQFHRCDSDTSVTIGRSYRIVSEEESELLLQWQGTRACWDHHSNQQQQQRFGGRFKQDYNNYPGLGRFVGGGNGSRRGSCKKNKNIIISSQNNNNNNNRPTLDLNRPNCYNNPTSTTNPNLSSSRDCDTNSRRSGRARARSDHFFVDKGCGRGDAKSPVVEIEVKTGSADVNKYKHAPIGLVAGCCSSKSNSKTLKTVPVGLAAVTNLSDAMATAVQTRGGGKNFRSTGGAEKSAASNCNNAVEGSGGVGNSGSKLRTRTNAKRGKAGTAPADRDGNNMLSSEDGGSSVTSSSTKCVTVEEQRLSFVSTSTGYSSARSSLRSSEGGNDDQHQSLSCSSFVDRSSTSSGVDHNNSSSTSSANYIQLSEECSLSHQTRLELLASGKVTQLDRIAMELLDTERTYLNDLNDIIEGYLNFLIRERDSLGVTAVDICDLFGCIEKVYKFNRQLYRALDAARLDTVRMAKCFVDYADGFSHYADYCAKYQKMISTLNNLNLDPSLADAMLGRQAALGHSLPLSSYLLKPVQRVLKYHLFLENMLKQWTSQYQQQNCTDLSGSRSRSPASVDRTANALTIRSALECMTARSKQINEVKKREEHAARVRELQDTLCCWDATDLCGDLSQYGDLIMEGSLKLCGTKTMRQLFLFEEMLLITKEKADKALVCKDYILCSNMVLSESVDDHPLAFQVLSYDSPRLQYTFVARSTEQKRQWTKELKRMLLDHFSKEIPEHSKHLMLAIEATPSNMGRRLHSNGLITGARTAAKKTPKYLDLKRKKSGADTGVVSTSTARFFRRRSQSASRMQLRAVSTVDLISGPLPFSLSSPVDDAASNAGTCDENGHIQQQDDHLLSQQQRHPLFSRRKSVDVVGCSNYVEDRKSSAHRPSKVSTPYRHGCRSQSPTTSTPNGTNTGTADQNDDQQIRFGKRLLQSDEIEQTFAALWTELSQFSTQGNSSPNGESPNNIFNNNLTNGELPGDDKTDSHAGSSDDSHHDSSGTDMTSSSFTRSTRSSLSPSGSVGVIRARSLCTRLNYSLLSVEEGDDDCDSVVEQSPCYDTVLAENLERKLSGSVVRGSVRQASTSIRQSVEHWEQRRHSTCAIGLTPKCGQRPISVELDPHLGVVKTMVKQLECVDAHVSSTTAGGCRSCTADDEPEAQTDAPCSELVIDARF